jgi:hypothetical protein
MISLSAQTTRPWFPMIFSRKGPILQWISSGSLNKHPLFEHFSGEMFPRNRSRSKRERQECSTWKKDLFMSKINIFTSPGNQAQNPFCSWSINIYHDSHKYRSIFNFYNAPNTQLQLEIIHKRLYKAMLCKKIIWQSFYYYVRFFLQNVHFVGMSFSFWDGGKTPLKASSFSKFSDPRPRLRTFSARLNDSGFASPPPPPRRKILDTALSSLWIISSWSWVLGAMEKLKIDLR